LQNLSATNAILKGDASEVIARSLSVSDSLEIKSSVGSIYLSDLKQTPQQPAFLTLKSDLGSIVFNETQFDTESRTEKKWDLTSNLGSTDVDLDNFEGSFEASAGWGSVKVKGSELEIVKSSRSAVTGYRVSKEGPGKLTIKSEMGSIKLDLDD
jgi:hypothetical protein